MLVSGEQMGVKIMESAVRELEEKGKRREESGHFHRGCFKDGRNYKVQH